MDYNSALEYIHSLERFGSIPGLERVGELLDRLGNPHKKIPFVHIAGTNGKGSTAAMTARILGTAGYKIGLYISPYVLEFRERMQINGEMISCSELAQCTQQVKAAADKMAQEGRQPTEFEVVTAVALLWYYHCSCDIVVLEVGLGGRFDATNIIDTPLVSAITAIDLDHTQILGDTVEQIAGEKCGIIKKSGTTVCYPNQHPDALAVIMEHCAINDNPLVMGNLNSVEIKSCSLEGSDIIYKGIAIHIPLIGSHQIANTVTVVEIIDCLRKKGYNIGDKDIQKGLSGVRFPARMEILSRSPLIILDGAHNMSGARALKSALDLAAGMRINAVCGMLEDKDYRGVLQLFPHSIDKLFTVTVDNPRSVSAKKLAETAQELGINARHCADPIEALRQAASTCPDMILIFGSLYLASGIRGIILGGEWNKNKTDF